MGLSCHCGFSFTDLSPPLTASQCYYSPPAGGEGRREEEAGEEERREEEVEDGEDEMDLPATLEATLDHLGLAGLTGVFLKEQIDFDSLVSLSFLLCLFRSTSPAPHSADVF